MATPLAKPAENQHTGLRAKFRAIFRLSRTALHLAGGLLTVALIYPFITQGTRLSLKQRWSRQLLTVLGVTLKVPEGDPQVVQSKYCTGADGTANVPETTNPAGLLVANHVSFLDIFVINAWTPAAFVAKDDVRNWPVIGWLSQHTETIFMQRGSRRAAHAARDHLVDQLCAKRLVAVFPEGTTSDGHTVQPFHSALFQSAIDASAPVIPLALRYFDAQTHQPSHAADYIDDLTLISCLWSIATSAGLIAQLEPLPALIPADLDRRHLAAHAHRAVAHRLLQMINPSLKVSPVADTADEIPAGLPAVQP